MAGKIVQLLISIGLIAGGLCGKLVLRGTDSSYALVIFGLVWLGIDIYNIVNKNKDEKHNVRIKRSKLFYGIFIVWITAEFFGSAFVGSYGSANTMDMLNWIIVSVGITVLGVWMFLYNARQKWWLPVSIMGSVVPVIYAFSTGAYVTDGYYNGVYGSRFSMPFLLVHLAANLLPGLLLLLQVFSQNTKMNNKNI